MVGNEGRKSFALGSAGAAPGGSGGAAEGGGLGAVGGRCVSESECDIWSPSAPVAIPPLVFFNFGMPPANKPPN